MEGKILGATAKGLMFLNIYFLLKKMYQYILFTIFSPSSSPPYSLSPHSPSSNQVVWVFLSLFRDHRVINSLGSQSAWLRNRLVVKGSLLPKEEIEQIFIEGQERDWSWWFELGGGRMKGIRKVIPGGTNWH